MTEIRFTPRRSLALAALLSSLLLGACASNKGMPPVAELANARASISQAESAGATQLAPVDLLAARDKLGRAEAAAREENYIQARRLAESAAADAELAERTARLGKAQEAAQELQRANAALERETKLRKEGN